MKPDFRDYDIHFSGLNLGEYRFEFEAGNDFFKAFDYSEFEDCRFKVEIMLQKTPSGLLLKFEIKGFARVRCDISGEPFDLPIDCKWDLIVKFSESYKYDGDDLLYLPHGENTINVASYIYETVILEIPMQKRHPALAEREDQIFQSFGDSDTTASPTDERWKKLEELFNK